MLLVGGVLCGAGVGGGAESRERGRAESVQVEIGEIRDPRFGIDPAGGDAGTETVRGNGGGAEADGGDGDAVGRLAGIGPSVFLDFFFERGTAAAAGFLLIARCLLRLVAATRFLCT